MNVLRLDGKPKKLKRDVLQKNMVQFNITENKALNKLQLSGFIPRLIQKNSEKEPALNEDNDDDVWQCEQGDVNVFTKPVRKNDNLV